MICGIIRLLGRIVVVVLVLVAWAICCGMVLVALSVLVCFVLLAVQVWVVVVNDKKKGREKRYGCL